MKQAMYEVIFEVTETLQNGKERRVKKSVYSPRFGEDGKHITETERIFRGRIALRECQYYDIVYIGTKATTLIFTA